MDANAAAYIAVGMTMLGTLGASLGIALLGYGAVQGIARNPEASGNILTNMILAIAFTEAVAIYCFVVALLLIFVA